MPNGNMVLATKHITKIRLKKSVRFYLLESERMTGELGVAMETILFNLRPGPGLNLHNSIRQVLFSFLILCFFSLSISMCI